MHRVTPVFHRKQGKQHTSLFFAFQSSAIEARPSEPFTLLQSTRLPEKPWQCSHCYVNKQALALQTPFCSDLYRPGRERIWKWLLLSGSFWKTPVGAGKMLWKLRKHVKSHPFETLVHILRRLRAISWLQWAMSYGLLSGEYRELVPTGTSLLSQLKFILWAAWSSFWDRA